MTRELMVRVEARGRAWTATLPIDDTLTLVEICELLPGHRPRHSCMVGACGTCRLRVVEGADLVEPNAFGEDYSNADKPGTILACLAGVRADRAGRAAAALIHLRAMPEEGLPS